MKELTLNPDGTLNIINPDKTYVFKIIIEGRPPNYWINARTQSGGHGFRNFTDRNSKVGSLFNERYLQYSCEYGLKFIKRYYPQYDGGLYQFNSEEDFIQCHGRGEI